MASQGIVVILNILIMIIALIPTYSFLKKYRELRLKEFQYFAIIFACTSTTGLGAIGIDLFDMLIFYQIEYMSLQIIYFALWGVSTRMVYEKTPKPLKYFTYLWFNIMMIITLFWRKVDQTRSAKVLFWNVDQPASNFREEGAGLYYDDTVIYSSGHNLILVIFIGYCLIYFFIALTKVTPMIESTRIQKSMRLWKLATLINLFWVYVMLPWTFFFHLNNILIVSMLVIISYIVFRIPEGMLISNTQFIRSYNLLIEIDAKIKEQGLESYSGMQGFLEYIEQIMEDPILRAQIEEKQKPNMN